MIADDRRSQIANNRRRSQKRLFPYNRNDRRADCSHTFWSAEMSNIYTRVWADEQTTSRTWKSGNFAASKFTSSVHSSYTFRQTKFKDFSRRKNSFQGPMFIQYINIFVPFFTSKTLNSVITYFRFSDSSALVDEVSLCNEIL